MSLEGKTRRQALTEFREAEILQAARKVFGEHGYANATVDLIAAAAGVAKGTIYLYYNSKDEIFWAALSSRFREMREQTDRAMAQAAGTAEKIRACLRVRFEFLRSDEQFMRMFVTEFGLLCRTQGQPMHALYRESVSMLADIIAEGVRAGELRNVPPVETATALMDLVKGIFTMRFSDLPALEPALDGADFVFNLFWNGVKA